MNLDLRSKLHHFALGAALVLGTSATFATAPAPRDVATEPRVLLAQATPAPVPTAAPAVDPAAGKDPLQAGAWRAAAEGIEPLRRYLFRTRMIYNFYIGDFVVRQ